ncbi:universal stress protein [Arthrobacter cryoconiti]|uniref:Universal stress protein n=1 Tax=Arthrobacter cryoconiti TaxID=748907 RepID=A0ABV8R013_9MICC|nr:universal stress protein [Arthrobacter cryoconiti]MCC9068471.1 universal stress protein [Arthrobacter cryoconiti]
MTEQKSSAAVHIVVGVDGSPESILALQWAQTLAPTLGASIMAVSAWRMETAMGPYEIPDWDPEPIAREILTDSLAKAFGDDVPEGLISRTFRGQASQVLIEASEKAKMLIVGSRGHGGFAGLLLGSVSSSCAEHAVCPVLVVHAEKSKRP